MSYQFLFFLMIRRPPRSTLDRSSAASDVYKRQARERSPARPCRSVGSEPRPTRSAHLSLIHISEPTRQAENSYAVFCLKKKKQHQAHLGGVEPRQQEQYQDRAEHQDDA